MAKRSDKTTPRQRKFLKLLPAIHAGDLTIEDALKKAGYSDSTARQQTETLNNIRHNSAMREALRRAGVTEDRIAVKIGKGMENMIPQVGLGYTKLAAELIDGFPSKKIEMTDPMTYPDVDDKPKAKSPEEARRLAEA